jgi:hypothetical protein
MPPQVNALIMRHARNISGRPGAAATPLKVAPRGDRRGQPDREQALVDLVEGEPQRAQRHAVGAQSGHPHVGHAQAQLLQLAAERIETPKFVGGDNYADLVHDAQFWNSLKVTAYYVVLNIGSQTVLALGLAALMHRLTRSVVLRATLLLPWLVPNVTVGLLWMWLLDANLGFVNHLLTGLGLSNQGFLTSPSWALPSIALINSWAYTGYTALLLYAGMLQIPEHLYESASLDGAGEFRMFRRITLPLLRPVLALHLPAGLHVLPHGLRRGGGDGPGGDPRPAHRRASRSWPVTTGAAPTMRSTWPRPKRAST